MPNSVVVWLAGLGILVSVGVALIGGTNQPVGLAAFAAAVIWTAVLGWRWLKRDRIRFRWPIAGGGSDEALTFAVPGVDPSDRATDPRANWFRCLHHVALYTLTRNAEPPSVTVHLEVWRQIRNITDTPRALELSPATDEWHIPEHPSKVVLVAARVGRNPWQRGDCTNISLEGHIYKARGLTVEVPASELVDTEMVLEETKQVSDTHWVDFAVPTRDPLVVVKAPP